MTDTRPEQGADELAVAEQLRALGVGPDADVPPMPALPPRLPAGYRKVPAPDPDDWFARLYGPNGESPIVPATSPDSDASWQDEDTAEERPKALAAALSRLTSRSSTIVVAPREPRNWSWLWQWVRPWQTVTAGTVSVLPLFSGWSLATGWARVLHEMRADTIAGAYTTTVAALALAYLLDLKRKRWLLRLALITTAIGSLGVLDWFDPITLVTGVHR